MVAEKWEPCRDGHELTAVGNRISRRFLTQTFWTQETSLFSKILISNFFCYDVIRCVRKVPICYIQCSSTDGNLIPNSKIYLQILKQIALKYSCNNCRRVDNSVVKEPGPSWLKTIILQYWDNCPNWSSKLVCQTRKTRYIWVVN